MKVLLVEDDQQIRQFLKVGLESEYFTVDAVEDGEEGSSLARRNEYDVIILDNMLPNKSGQEICREVRLKEKKTPIIILSVISDTTKKVDMLNCGADDYLTKPFSFEELLARVRAVLRRPAQIQSEVLSAGSLKLDSSRHMVTNAGQDVYLTKKEFELLEYLMRNTDRVVSRGMILEHVWDMNADPFSNTIETHILNLRRKIDPETKNKIIQTIPGRGYRLTTRVTN